MRKVGSHSFLYNYERKEWHLRFGVWTLIYVRGHDKRYAHIPKHERWRYPDFAEPYDGEVYQVEKFHQREKVKIGGGGRFIDYLIRWNEDRKEWYLRQGSSVFLYYKDHDDRYAFTEECDRWMYPDEVRRPLARYIRERTYDELKEGVDITTALRLMGGEGRRKRYEKLLGKPLPDNHMFHGDELLLLAKDVPITRVS